MSVPPRPSVVNICYVWSFPLLHFFLWKLSLPYPQVIMGMLSLEWSCSLCHSGGYLTFPISLNTSAVGIWPKQGYSESTLGIDINLKERIRYSCWDQYLWSVSCINDTGLEFHYLFLPPCGENIPKDEASIYIRRIFKNRTGGDFNDIISTARLSCLELTHPLIPK